MWQAAMPGATWRRRRRYWADKRRSERPVAHSCGTLCVPHCLCSECGVFKVRVEAERVRARRNAPQDCSCCRPIACQVSHRTVGLSAEESQGRGTVRWATSTTGLPRVAGTKRAPARCLAGSLEWDGALGSCGKHPGLAAATAAASCRCRTPRAAAAALLPPLPLIAPPHGDTQHGRSQVGHQEPVQQGRRGARPLQHPCACSSATGIVLGRHLRCGPLGALATHRWHQASKVCAAPHCAAALRPTPQLHLISVLESGLANDVVGESAADSSPDCKPDPAALMKTQDMLQSCKQSAVGAGIKNVKMTTLVSCVGGSTDMVRCRVGGSLGGGRREARRRPHRRSRASVMPGCNCVPTPACARWPGCVRAHACPAATHRQRPLCPPCRAATSRSMLMARAQTCWCWAAGAWAASSGPCTR